MKNTYRLGFVILHFKVVAETIACIQSILKNIDTDNYHIIVVDNGSNDGSGQSLEKQYDDNEKVTVIISQDNNGFSGGNNIGYRFAKEDACDFICMTNNDTEIMQNDFFACMLEEYEYSNFAVLGPEIHLLDDSICSYPKQILKLSQLQEERNRVHKLLFKNKWFIESIDLFVKHSLMKLIGWNKVRHKFRVENVIEKRQEMVRIHGCCMIFSPIYIQKFDGLENRTFFYGEEDVLFVQLVRNQMKSVYQPKVKIKHHEQAATSELLGKNYKKRRYTYEMHLNTLAMLETLYYEDLESLEEFI